MKTKLTLIATIACLMASPATWAGVNQIIYTYGPAANSVPTMQPSMLIALAVITVVVGFRVLKARGTSGAVLSLFIVSVVGVTSLIGASQTIADLAAQPIPNDAACNSGGSVMQSNQSGISGDGTEMLNNCPNAVQILNIQGGAGCTVTPPTSPEPGIPLCSQGTVVGSGEACDLHYCVGPGPGPV